MSATYLKICRRYYERGNYTAENLCTFVRVGKLTEDEYYQITGFVYPATSAEEENEEEE